MNSKLTIRQLILIGFMGTGKTTIGSAIAERTGWNQVDIDHQIAEAVGKEIREIFAEEGEDAFRALESQVLEHVLASPVSQIVTTGGGVVTRPCNVEIMKQRGLTVALTAEPETIIDRLRADTSRPLLAGDMERNVRRLMEERAGLYDFAPVRLSTDGKSVEEIVDELWAHPVFQRFLAEND